MGSSCIYGGIKLIAISNFFLHLTNIVMHIYYYSLAARNGIVLSIIGIFLLIFSLYNYLLICGCTNQIKCRNIYIWKICCWIETGILFGSGFAEGILILLYSNVLYFEVSIWHLLALCVFAIIDISAHLMFLLLISCCYNVTVKDIEETSVTLKGINDLTSQAFAAKKTGDGTNSTSPIDSINLGMFINDFKFIILDRVF